jgi:hypothetical protein
MPFNPFAFAMGGAAYKFVAMLVIHNLHNWAQLEEHVDS